MARQNQDVPIREHMRRRGVVAQPGGGVEADAPAQAPAAPAGSPNFGDVLFGQEAATIPHELKLEIMKAWDASDPSNPQSIQALHKMIYDSALPGGIKDQLANLRTYAPHENRNRNRNQFNQPDISGMGPSDTLNPNTGQAWDRGIGPSMRAKILEKYRLEHESPEDNGPTLNELPVEISGDAAPRRREGGPPSGPIRYEPPKSGGKPPQTPPPFVPGGRGAGTNRSVRPRNIGALPMPAESQRSTSGYVEPDVIKDDISNWNGKPVRNVAGPPSLPPWIMQFLNGGQ